MTRWFPRGLLVLALVAGVTAACSDDDPTGPTGNPLAGLTRSESRDSAGNTPPPPPGTQGPGYFVGRVLGQAPPGSGNDSLSTMPRIAGVRVTAFPKLSDGATPQVGPQAASVVTGTDGAFQLPQLPGGDYVVTFTPPDNSGYQGVWVTAPAHPTSHLHPWWVVLPKK